MVFLSHKDGLYINILGQKIKSFWDKKRILLGKDIIFWDKIQSLWDKIESFLKNKDWRSLVNRGNTTHQLIKKNSKIITTYLYHSLTICIRDKCFFIVL